MLEYFGFPERKIIILESKDGVLLSDILIQNSVQALKESKEVQRFTRTVVNLRGENKKFKTPLDTARAKHATELRKVRAEFRAHAKVIAGLQDRRAHKL